MMQSESGKQLRLHAAVALLTLLADQLTKFWARARFSLPDGQPNYADHIAVLGDWMHLRLVYNEAAAFGMKPHAILPFLHPMMFYVVFSAVAIVLLGLYYRRLGPGEAWGRLGVALIISGAIGNNLIDRLFMHKVTDFLDVGIPGVSPRWPVFNIADSAVSVGIALLLLPPLFARRASPPPASQPPGAPATPEAPEARDERPAG